MAIGEERRAWMPLNYWTCNKAFSFCCDKGRLTTARSSPQRRPHTHITGQPITKSPFPFSTYSDVFAKIIGIWIQLYFLLLFYFSLSCVVLLCISHISLFSFYDTFIDLRTVIIFIKIWTPNFIQHARFFCFLFCIFIHNSYPCPVYAYHIYIVQDVILGIILWRNLSTYIFSILLNWSNKWMTLIFNYCFILSINEKSFLLWFLK